MELLRKRRGTYKGILSRIEKYFRETANENISAADANTRLIKLEENMQAFEQVQLEIEALLPDTELSEEEGVREEFENKYYTIKTWCSNKINPGRMSVSAESTNVHHTQHISPEFEESVRLISNNQASIASALTRLSEANIGGTSQSHSGTKLPTCSIPTFSGEYKEWPTFKDLFTTIIHQSRTLSGAQKLQYLKLSLKGEAASLLRHINVSDANYEQAWQDLNSMYDKEKIIIESYVRTIMEQPVVGPLPGASSIRNLFSTTKESISGLKSLKVPTEQWDCWLIYVIASKLDVESKQLWARQTASVKSPTFDEMMQFLSARVFELESSQANKQISSSTYKNKRQAVHSVISLSCTLCKENHFVSVCPQFTKLDLNERRSVIAQNRLCYNCLNSGHSVKNCKSSTCRKCKGKHHTLIHTEPSSSRAATSVVLNKSTAEGECEAEGGENNDGAVDASQGSANVLTVSVNQSLQTTKKYNLLPTAIILVKDNWGVYKPCRALLDSGSQVSLITEACVQYLGLKRSHSNLTIDAVGEGEAKVKGTLNLELKSRINDFKVSTQAAILGTITKRLPQHKVYYDVKTRLGDIDLADPHFSTPRSIDILLRASIVLKSINGNKIFDENNKVIAMGTEFGWVLASEDDDELGQRRVVYHTLRDLNSSVERFWEIEEPNPTNTRSFDFHPCERHFKEHYRRMKDGRFIVRLPFKEGAVMDGDSRAMAEQRLKAMERRFLRDKELRKMYVNFMEEYQNLGHMTEIEPGKEHAKEGYYLPHHAVIKPESSTTKLRVVFDASCNPCGGKSLNSQLLNGPVLQKDLTHILLRFMINPIALSADIAQMYRQVVVDERDRCFQRILWRSSPSNDIKEYELNTITYGTTPASFLATRVLLQLAEDEAENFPEASALIGNNFYMDDFIFSCSSEEEARMVVDQLCQLLQSGGLILRKWSSNSRSLLDGIPVEKREPSWSWSIESNQSIKTLGLRWHPITDSFSFKLQRREISCFTKRNLLSEMSRIFDPLGYLAPYIINYRILLQRVWEKGIDWDDQVPINVIQKWEELRKGLNDVEQIEISRYEPHDKESWEMHGFADASEDAYGAVLYLRSVNGEGRVITSFVTARAKVAPLKPILVTARLELCAAHLLAKLVTKIRELPEYKDIPVYCWTDSMVTLHWISGNPRRFASFIANRVSAINCVVPRENWFHVRGEVNPADCASRGISGSLLLNHPLWWRGPAFLLQNPVIFESTPSYHVDKGTLEERKVVMSAVCCDQTSDYLERYSSLNRLLRITANLLRFVNNCKVQRANWIFEKFGIGKKEDPIVGWLTSHELKNAFIALIKAVQIRHFGEIRADLEEGKQASEKELLKLNPILDRNGIMRVGGRLHNASFGYEQRHPAIIPNKGNFVELVMKDTHLKYLHAGPQLVGAIIRRQVWILGARNAIRKFVHRCIDCQRFRAKPMHQLMGNLPTGRFQKEKAFLNAGVDYAGPFMATPRRSRGCRSQKVYIAVFICFATKAVHLEMVSDLSTEGFLSALHRFIARRGECRNIYSDNGTNFVGAKNLLGELKEFLSKKNVQERLNRAAVNDGTNWHFIPPAAPNFGGLWEAAVKSAKFHLRRVAGNVILSFEEFQTLLCKIEACLNSRPLVPMTCNPDDFEPLTPAHFLVGTSLHLIPEPDYENVKPTLLSRFQFISKLQQVFWKRWQDEYVTSLQQRLKWNKQKENLRENDLVLIRDDNQPPGRWLMGRVREIHCGSDGLVRVATILTKNGIIKRSIAKLVQLITTESS